MTYREALSNTARGDRVSAERGDHGCSGKQKEPCPQLGGTILRIFIPAGAVINLLNLIELTSPSGIYLIIRLPFLAKKSLHDCSVSDLAGIFDSIKRAGGTVEFVNH